MIKRSVQHWIHWTLYGNHEVHVDATGVHQIRLTEFNRGRGFGGGSQENLGGGGHNVRQARFTVQFAGILGRPHPGGADDALLPELLFIRPRQRVTRQGGQTVVRVTEGGGFCEKEKKKRTSGLKCGTGKKNLNSM